MSKTKRKHRVYKKKEPKTFKEQFIEHMTSTKGSGWREYPHWFFYIVLVLFIYGIATNIPW